MKSLIIFYKWGVGVAACFLHNIRVLNTEEKHGGGMSAGAAAGTPQLRIVAVLLLLSIPRN